MGDAVHLASDEEGRRLAKEFIQRQMNFVEEHQNTHLEDTDDIGHQQEFPGSALATTESNGIADSNDVDDLMQRIGSFLYEDEYDDTYDDFDVTGALEPDDYDADKFDYSKMVSLTVR